MSTQAIAPRSPVLEAIEKAKPSFEGRLPEGMAMERFTYGLATSVQKNPALLACDPKSIILAAYEAAECGCDLSPSKALGWIIPYGQQAQFQPSYRHFIQLAYKSGCVKAFNAEVVCRNDKFKIVFAPVRTIIHEPNLGDRGEAIGAYAIVQFLDDHIDFEFLNAAQISVHKNASKIPNSLMWTKFWEEAWRKTAVRVLSKRLPQTNPAMERLAELVQKDADDDLDLHVKGEMELEPDSPLTRAAIPAADTSSSLEEYIGGDEDKPVAQATDSPRLFVNFHVGKDHTRITGQTQTIEKQLRNIFAERSKDGKAWQISAASTEKFLAICEERGISAIEVDDKGNPAAPATLLDLYEDK